MSVSSCYQFIQRADAPKRTMLSRGLPDTTTSYQHYTNAYNEAGDTARDHGGLYRWSKERRHTSPNSRHLTESQESTGNGISSHRHHHRYHDNDRSDLTSSSVYHPSSPLTNSGRSYNWQSRSWSSSQNNSVNITNVKSREHSLCQSASYKKKQLVSQPVGGAGGSYIDIFSHPQDVEVTLNSKLLLMCEARILYSHDRPLYQWYKDEEPLIGEVESTFVKESITEEDIGYYVCIVSDVKGTVSRKSKQACVRLNEQESMSTILTEPSPPSITEQPPNLTCISPGDRLQLKIHVMANPYPTFRWFRNSIELPYAIGNELTVPCVTSRDEGQYVCSITNDWGSVLSNVFTIRVINDLRRSSFDSFDYNDDSEYGKVALPPSYSAPNSPRKPLKKQQSKAVTISDSILLLICNQIKRQINSYRLNQLALSLDISTYDLATIRVHYKTIHEQVMQLLYTWRANNSHRSNLLVLEDLLVSEGFSISLPQCLQPQGDPPRIIIQPENTQVMQGDSVRLNITIATNNDICQYQWFKDGVPLHDQTMSMLYIPNTTRSCQGLYYCTVTNTSGRDTSDKVHVDVTPMKIKLPPSLQHSANSNSSHPGSLYLPPSDVMSPHRTTERYSPWEPYSSPSSCRGSGHFFHDSFHMNQAGYNSFSGKMEHLKITEGNSTKPAITKHPQSQEILLGGPLHLSVCTNGHHQYQWYFNGLALPKETQSQFFLNCFTEEDVGDYYCEISNDDQHTTKSNVARINILDDNTQ